MNHFEEKAAFTPEPDLYGYATPAIAPDEAVAKSDVIDLTAKMQPGWNSGLDAARRPLGCAAIRVLAAGDHQPSGDRGGDRPGGGQAGQADL